MWCLVDRFINIGGFSFEMGMMVVSFSCWLAIVSVTSSNVLPLSVIAFSTPIS